MKIAATGYGAGGYDFPDRANVLRVILGEETGAAEATAITVLEANIDDLSPQILAYAMDRLLENGRTGRDAATHRDEEGPSRHAAARAGAPGGSRAMAQLIFAETSTLGLRTYTAERRVQARHWVDVETPQGKVRMKVSGDGAYAPEYEDCRRIAQESGVPLKHVIAEANFAYLKNSR